MKKTARKNPRPSKVSREVFCRTWNTSESVAEVAEKLNMNPASAVSKASVLRKSGVNLKHFKQGRPKSVSAESLNEILGTPPKAPTLTKIEVMNEILRCLKELVNS